MGKNSFKSFWHPTQDHVQSPSSWWSWLIISNSLALHERYNILTFSLCKQLSGVFTSRFKRFFLFPHYTRLYSFFSTNIGECLSLDITTSPSFLFFSWIVQWKVFSFSSLILFFRDYIFVFFVFILMDWLYGLYEV